MQGVCITGGEPTLHPDLPAFIRSIKQLGYLVKLDTNGTNPSMLQTLLDECLIDYAAMDIKSSKAQYARASGLPASFDTTPLLTSIEASIKLLQRSAISYEFRTTVTKELHNLETLKQIGEWLNGSAQYYLQNYEENENVIQPAFHAYEKETLLGFSRQLAPFFSTVGIRGIS